MNQNFQRSPRFVFKADVNWLAPLSGNPGWSDEEKDGKLEDAFQVSTIFFLLSSPSQTKYFPFPNIFLSFLLPSDLRPHISLSVLRSNDCLLFFPGLIPNVCLRQIISSFIQRPNDFPSTNFPPPLPRFPFGTIKCYFGQKKLTRLAGGVREGQNIAQNGPRFWLWSPLEAPKWVKDPGNGPQMIPPTAPD